MLGCRNATSVDNNKSIVCPKLGFHAHNSGQVSIKKNVQIYRNENEYNFKSRYRMFYHK